MVSSKRIDEATRIAILAAVGTGVSNREAGRVFNVAESSVRRMREAIQFPIAHSETSNVVKRVLALSDIHWPEAHIPTLNIAFQMMQDMSFDGFVFLGDQFDNSVISHHNKGKGLLKPRGAFYTEENSFDEQVLKPIERLMKPDSFRVWIKGNHDHWETQYVEEYPELAGKIERDISLKLADRGWQVVECGKSFTHGKLTYIHGESLTGSSHAKKALEVYCTNVLYGHFHGPQSATKILPHDQTQKWQAWCSPIVGECNPYYMRNKPSGWANGFTVVEYRNNGNFNLYPVITSGNEACYGGKIYRA